MSVSVQLGLLLAVADGVRLGRRVPLQVPRSPRGAGGRAAPAARSSVALFRSPLYTLGIVIALGSWGLHVGALALAPISLVQSVIAGGLVLLTVVADRLFGIAVTRREWIGVGLTAAGLGVPRRDAGRRRPTARTRTTTLARLRSTSAPSLRSVCCSPRVAASDGRWPSPPACCGRPPTPRSRR